MTVVDVLIAVVIGAAIWFLGRWFIKMLATPPPEVNPEDVVPVRQDYRCSVCGTEVTMTVSNQGGVEPPQALSGGDGPGVAPLNRPIRGVVLDVGETLIDETEYWGRFADRLGVTRLTFFATFGWIIKSGAPHQEVFARLAPDIDWRSVVPDGEAPFGATDLYPDAVPTVERLRTAGFLVVVAGNQPMAGEQALAEAGVRADLVISSDRLGAAKPDPQFFAELAAAVNLDPSEMVSVGDRVDNDVLPALEAGMAAIHLRRGPWGIAHLDHPGAAKATACVDSLTETADLLALL